MSIRFRIELRSSLSERSERYVGRQRVWEDNLLS
jgi:hypothetical protein